MQIAGHRMYFLTSELCSWVPTWSARGPEKALSWWAGGRCPGRGFHPAHCTTESCVSDLPGGAFSVLVTLVTRESPDSEAWLSPHCLPSPDSCSLWLSCLRLVCKVPVLRLFAALLRSLPRQRVIHCQVPMAWLGLTPFSTSFPPCLRWGSLFQPPGHHTAHGPDGRACPVLRAVSVLSLCPASLLTFTSSLRRVPFCGVGSTWS